MCSLFAILFNNYSLKYRMLIVLINNNGQTLRRVLAPKSKKSSETTGSKDMFHAARRTKSSGDLRRGMQSADCSLPIEWWYMESFGSRVMFHAARRPRLDGDLRRGVQSAERNITTEWQSAESPGEWDYTLQTFFGTYDSVRPSSVQYCSSRLTQRQCSIPLEFFSHRNSTSPLQRKRQNAIPLGIFYSSYENIVKISSNPSAAILIFLSIHWAQKHHLKGTVSRDFWTLVFFIFLFHLTSLFMDKKDFVKFCKCKGTFMSLTAVLDSSE